MADDHCSETHYQAYERRRLMIRTDHLFCLLDGGRLESIGRFVTRSGETIEIASCQFDGVVSGFRRTAAPDWEAVFLLRYDHEKNANVIKFVENSGGTEPYTEEEIAFEVKRILEKWRSSGWRVLQDEETHEERAAEPAGVSQPYFLLCSGCRRPCPSDEAHVVPNWNDVARDFLTTYRCGDCWIPTLEENRRVVRSLDDEMRARFCEFMRRHGYEKDADFIGRKDPPEGRAFIEEFIDAIAAERIRLLP